MTPQEKDAFIRAAQMLGMALASHPITLENLEDPEGVADGDTSNDGDGAGDELRPGTGSDTSAARD